MSGALFAAGCLGAAAQGRRDESPLSTDQRQLLYELNSLRLAIEDLTRSFGSQYPDGARFLDRLGAIQAEARTDPVRTRRRLDELKRDALLANPLLQSNQLLVVKRRPSGQRAGPGLEIAMPSNHECNASLPRTGYDNELCLLSPIGPSGTLHSLYRPPHGGYVGEVDLHWDADRLLFTQSDPTNWKVFELRLGTAPAPDASALSPGQMATPFRSTAIAVRVRQVSTMPDDVDSFDACYLPNGRILFWFDGLVSIRSLLARLEEGVQSLPHERGRLRRPAGLF